MSATTLHDQVIDHYNKTFPRPNIFVNNEGQEIFYKEKWRFSSIYEPFSTLLLVEPNNNIVVGLVGYHTTEPYKKKLVGLNILEARKVIHTSLYKTVCYREFESLEAFKETCKENIKLFIKDANSFIAAWEKQYTLWHKWNESLSRKPEAEPKFPESVFSRHFREIHECSEQGIIEYFYKKCPNLIHFYQDTKLFPR